MPEGQQLASSQHFCSEKIGEVSVNRMRPLLTKQRKTEEKMAPGKGCFVFSPNK
jgi:hypothetical protein